MHPQNQSPVFNKRDAVTNEKLKENVTTVPRLFYKPKFLKRKHVYLMSYPYFQCYIGVDFSRLRKSFLAALQEMLCSYVMLSKINH